MLLKSLELQGFKTFPDKTSLKFETGITSVVGPNGSGKSNISDAMRWVLGEQSVKILRCSKMEDVVFSGTKERRAQGYAQVVLHIDNTDRRLDFDNDSVSIARRYYRSGESEYLINNSQVRLKDVNELFMDTGLGRDGYSIIGQGKIDSIVGAKSEERREIFEEAAGISRFRYRKEESIRNLNRAEENLVRLRDIFSELEERVGPLKIQAEQAEKFISLDNKKKSLEIGIWVETLSRFGNVLREQEEKIGTLQSQYTEIEAEINLASALADKQMLQNSEYSAKLDFTRNEAARLDEQAVRTDGEISVLMNEISHNLQNVQRIAEQIESEKKSKTELIEDIRDSKEKLMIKEAEAKENAQALSLKEEKLKEIQLQAAKSGSDIDSLTSIYTSIGNILAEKKLLQSSILATQVEMRLQGESAKLSKVSAVEQIDALEIEEFSLKHTMELVQKEISFRQNAVKGYEMQLRSRGEKLESAKNNLDKLVLDGKEQFRRAKLLEDLERNLEGFAGSVKSVVQAANRNELNGVYGPVTKILQVPAAYALALETALGGAAQNILVESERDAKAAIRYLRQKKVGRATFLPRTVMRGNEISDQGVSDMVGYVGIASALCSSEEKFTSIRNYLLGRVIVAEDLDSAAAIAKQVQYRYRVVSLDGQVVNAGGSLTGGAKAKNSGLLSRRAEIEQIRKNAEVLEGQSDTASVVFKELQLQWKTSEDALQTQNAEAETFKEDLLKLRLETGRIKNRKEALHEQMSQQQSEHIRAIKRIEEQDKHLEITQAEILQSEAEMKELSEEIRQNSTDRDDQMLKSDTVIKEIQEARLFDYASRKDSDVLKEKLSALEHRQEDFIQFSEKLFLQEEQLQRKEESLKVEVAVKKQESSQWRKEAREMRDELQVITNKRSELEEKLGRTRKAEKEMSVSRENVGRELSRMKERLGHDKKEYDSTVTKLWDEYELTRREAEEQGETVKDLQKARITLADIKNQIRALGLVNVGAVIEYQEVFERYTFLKDQIADVEESKQKLLVLIDTLQRQMREKFVERFSVINKNFQDIFRELFGGGSAELVFTDVENVLQSGIEIRVHPPGKIVMHIESLSGGEKALVAISIYFAIIRVNPPPFCVLDEIEAALDDVNVVRFSQYLKKMSDQTQFIAITHRRGTMEGSDMLYGVTMQENGVSKLLALKTEQDRVTGIKQALNHQ